MHNNLVWGLFIFRRYPNTGAHQSAVMASQVTHFIPRPIQPNLTQLKKLEKYLEKRGEGPDGDWIEKAEIRTRHFRHFWQWAKHAWLYSDLLLVLKGEYLSVLDSQQRGP